MSSRVLSRFESRIACWHALFTLLQSAIFFLLVATCFVANAEDFNWHILGGPGYVSPVRDQGSGGTCWAFAATAALEAKYMITRNDPNFAPNISEQNLVCDGTMGNATIGGREDLALDYFTTTGVVSEAELGYNATNIAQGWPLQSGWENRVWMSTSNRTWLGYYGYDTAAKLKSALKAFGPLVTAMSVDNDWYPSPGSSRGGHAVLVTGFHDDSTVPGGGYWIVKNSWGSTWNGDGYGKIAYATLQSDPIAVGRIHAIDGSVYYTGAMAKANWNGGSSGTWSKGSSNWTSGSSAYSWENKETDANFGAGGPTNSIAVSGTVIAHGLTFNTGATGFTLSGGEITVTGGGITANESVTINSPVTVGAPQTWTTVAGKKLTLGGNVHTVISTLTVDGDGDTYIAGALDGGGAINLQGAPAGSLVKMGAGTLTVAGASNYNGAITISSGKLNLAPGLGVTATYSGVIDGEGSLTKSGAGTIVLSAASTYLGSTLVSGGTMQVTGTLGSNGSSNVFVAKDANGILADGNGDAAITRRVLSKRLYAGLGSAVTNLDAGDLPTTADILGGKSSAQADVSMAWRTRTLAEKGLAGGGGLVSEVLRLTGIIAPSGGGARNGSRQTDMFVLQMSYDPAQVLNLSDVNGTFFLGYLDLGSDGLRGTADDQWGRAVDGNFGGTAKYVGNVSYQSAYFVLGDYGVDTSSHVVWAVLNHNSEFAVMSLRTPMSTAVPEPSTFALLGSCALGLLIYAWRQKLIPEN